ncbi:MAG TPA: alpha/beta hydrolase [Candidatus Angelobacter sp.]|nr:alpha/beta hydrolase [Candidatus Angelobacter sp.]
MATIKVNGVELFYKESGSGPETIVFSHGLLMDHSMFDAQRAAFQGQYRVIAYDHRGQGQSQASTQCDMDTLTDDAAAFIQALNAGPCHFAGLSMGGFVGIRLAARHPELVRSLTLMCTGAESEPLHNRIRYGLLGQIVKIVSPAPFVAIAIRELFGATTRKDPSKQALVEAWKAKIRSWPRTLAYSILSVMNRRDAAADLGVIRCPTLVITGEDDTAQPPQNGERMAAGIRLSTFIKIPACGHSCSLEAPEAVVEAMKKILCSNPEVLPQVRSAAASQR